MAVNDNTEDPDFRLLSSISRRFAESMRAGDAVSIENTMERLPEGLKDVLFDSLLAIELKHIQSQGRTPEIDVYLARFPNYADAVSRAFSNAMTSDYSKRTAAPSPSLKDAEADTRTIIAGHEDSALTQTFMHNTDVDVTDTSQTLASVVPVYPPGKRYLVEKEIDRGGMGVVLKVRDEHLQRTLALKVIRGQERASGSSVMSSDQRMLARFVREAQVTGQLDHPGVVPIHELATDKEGRIYFTMKFVQGQTLAKVISELQKPSSHWDQARVLEVLVRVCETLAFAHSKGIIHRDLKPANIMVGEFGEAYVMDWGLAKILGESDGAVRSAEPRHDARENPSSSQAGMPLQVTSKTPSESHSQTMYGDVIGTAYYMPPEQAAGRIDELDQRTDVYSLGAVLYEVLTGTSPYKGTKRSGTELIKEVLNGPPKPIRELCRKAAPELVAIVEKAMSRKMDDRYASIGEVADDLRAYLSRRVVSAYRTGVTAQLKKWVARNQGFTIAGMITLLTIATALGVVALQQFSIKKEVENNNAELARLLNEKEEAIAASEAAAIKEQIARDEANGLSLMNHSKNVLAQGDATLASLLALESQVRFPRATTNETLYAAVAELVNSIEFDLTSRCNDLVWSPDDRHLLAVCSDGSGTIWDVGTKTAVATIVNTGDAPISMARYSSDGRFILTAGTGGSVALWDAETGIRKLSLSVGSTEKPPTGESQNRPNVIFAAFVDDFATGESEARIVAATATGTLHIYDRSTGRQLRILKPTSEAPASPFRTFAVSPDGHTFVAGCDDGQIFVWRDQQFVKSIDQHKHPIQRISFSPDGKFFSTCAFTGSLQAPGILASAACWHAETGELHHEISPDGLHVCCAEFHSTKPLLVLGLSDRTLCLWDFQKQVTSAVSRPQDEMISQLSISTAGDQIVTTTSSNVLMTWDLERLADTISLVPAQRLFGHRQEISHAVFGNSGTRIASAAENEVRIWSSRFEDAIPSFGAADFTNLVRFSREGDRIVESSTTDVEGRLWSYPDIGLTKRLRPAAGSSATFYAAPFLTGDDRHVAASFSDRSCRLWDSDTGELQFETQSTEVVRNIVCSGNRICLASDAGVEVWDWKTHDLLGKLRTDEFASYRVSWDGRFLLGHRQNHDDGKMASFNVTGDLAIMKEIEGSETCKPGEFSRSGQYLWCLGTQHPGHQELHSTQVKLIDAQEERVLFATDEGESLVLSVGINNNDTLMLVEYVQGVEHTAALYSIPDGILMGRIGPPEGRVVGWSPDFHFAAIRSSSGETQLWDTSSREDIANLDLSGSQCEAVCFSPDGKYFSVSHSPQSSDSSVQARRVSLWLTETMSLITMVPGENRCDFYSTFLSDGKSFWTLSGSNRIRIWPLDIVRCAKDHLLRTLTIDEERMFGVDGVRQAPLITIPQRSARELEWGELSSQVQLLSPVTPERVRRVVKVIAEIQRWLSDKGTPEEIARALTAVEQFRSGSFDTDPLVLEAISKLHEKCGDQIGALRILELAARHPRGGGEFAPGLQVARSRIAPALVSLQGADVVFQAAFSSDASEEDKQAFEDAVNWAAENSPLIADYFKARRHRSEQHPELAEPILQQWGQAAFNNDDSAGGPELFLQLAMCQVELGKPDAAAEVLRKALHHDRFRAPSVWNLWLQISFSNLQMTPKQLLTQLPAMPVRASSEPSYGDCVTWLLEQLSQAQPLRINCGGDHYLAADGSVWAGDRFYTHGFGYFGHDGEAGLFSAPIDQTADPFLYQSERWYSNNRHDRPACYQIPLPNGAYEVKLGFAEIYPAERSFDVVLEDNAVLTKYDPAHGAWATADDFTETAVVKDGMLDINLVSQNGEDPKISCLQIRPIQADSKE